MIAEAPDPQQQDDLNERHERARQEDARKKRPRRKGAEPESFQQSGFSSDDELDAKGGKARRHDAVGRESRDVVLDPRDSSEDAEFRSAAARCEQEEEEDGKADGEGCAKTVPPERELFVVDLASRQAQALSSFVWNAHRCAHDALSPGVSSSSGVLLPPVKAR